jgi:DNA-binding transcriptional LysR family regulator
MITVLDLRLLAALEAVVDEGTFAQAAARTGYTQSSLSQQIAALERSVGGRVFDRPGGPRRV